MEFSYQKLVHVSSKMIQMESGERVEEMSPLLLAWFSENARVLPWRENPLPYYVWVSEIMLQQTRVEAVKPFFARFIETLPTIKALAECEETLLLKLWEGLGYYNRVRNLQKAAQVVMREYEGELPADYELLLKLPGIGSYTAGAIASIAYGIAVPAVDGNVLRVMARLTENYEDIAKASVKKQMEELLLCHMPKEAPGAFNQAMMEIGATVCIPNGEPKCERCPIQSLCVAKAKRVAMELPVKTKKKARRVEEMTVFVIKNLSKEQELLLRKRQESGLLAGMYEFPNTESYLDEEEAKKRLEEWNISNVKLTPIVSATHIFSHVEWHMKGYYVEGIWEKEENREKNKHREAGKETEKREDEQSEEKWMSQFESIQIEKIQSDIAIPSAFSAYSSYMKSILGKNQMTAK